MDISLDFEDLFKTLNAFRIKYLVVGAHAVMFYTEPRYTKDMDVWIVPEINDAEKVYEALKQFGAPLKNLFPADFKDKKMILQIGVPPVRIDIMLEVPGIVFASAWKNKKKTKYGKTPIYILGIEDIMRAKQTAGRPTDLGDLEKLKRKNKSLS